MNRKQSWKLLEPFPIDFPIKTKGKSIGKRPGSSLEPFPIDFLIKTKGKSVGNRPGSSWSHFL